MLKCSMKGDPSAVFPKERSVLLLAAVVLLVCCCLVVPAAAAITLDDVEVNVSGDSCCEISPHPTEKNTYYITVADYVGTGTDLDYYFSVNVTSPLVGEGVVSVEWTKYILWGWDYRGFPLSSNNISNGDSLTSTTVAVHSPTESLSSGEAPYYTAEIIVDDSSSLTLTFYVSTHILIKPMDLTIYANQSSDFPVPRYEYRYEIDRSVFKVDGKDFCFGYENDKYPFTINYYNVTTGYKVICPAEPGTYRAVIEPVDGQDLSEISIKRLSYEYPLLYAEGTLTILPTTKNVMLSPSTSPDTVPAGNKDIFAYIRDCTYSYLNGGYDSKYEERSEHSVHDTVYFLQDDLLDEEAALITDYIRENRPGYDAEMKYFDMVADNIWVELYNSPSVYWPYPEGTDENTEFTLLYFPDTRRSIDITGTIVTTLGEPISLDITKHDHYLYYEYWNYAGLYALIWEDATDPVVIEPVNLTIYANEKFPLPLYSGIPEDAVIKANGQTYPVADPPFKIAYYNTTTNTQISPDTPGIYNATIQPVLDVQLEQITINGNPVLFRNGTLTIRQITDASETIPVAQQTLGGDRISVSVPEDTTYYLNNNTSLPVTGGNIHLLHDEILAGGEDTLKQIAPEYFDDSSKYEMKYFDLIDTGNGHTWVSSSEDVTITWPYPEGTDENTEFTLLHYLDLHREYFTDEDLNSKTKTVMVSKTGSGVQFSIQRSGFSPFALIWSDQKPVPTPPSGGGSSDGNMDNAFRVLFNDGATTLFVVTDLSYGDKLTKPEDPVKDGYTFAGWHKDAACTQAWDFADGIAGDMTLYAKWTPVQTVTPTVTPTATASVTPTVTAEPSGLPTTTPT
ncbi:MAG TPA: InlB B-repeat-containing protein, partial [Methanocorpusculum sp.]|nr:InlB B-repeat-containing protein [Methanocorpusculum sp.]